MSLDRCGLCLSRRRTQSRIGCAGARWRGDIIAEQIDRGLLPVYRGLAGGGDSLGSRTFDLGFLLYNGERLFSQ